MAVKPCTIGARHSWVFMKNVVQSSVSADGRSGSVQQRGRYRCACGARKFGGPLTPDQLSPADHAKRDALIATPQPAAPSAATTSELQKGSAS